MTRITIISISFITAFAIGVAGETLLVFDRWSEPVIPQVTDVIVEVPLTSNSDIKVPVVEYVDTVELFSDEKQIGRRGKNKVEVKCSGLDHDRRALIRFYKLAAGEGWELRQSFDLKIDGYPVCDPQLKDFNNDSLHDLTLVSNVAARGANEVRTLFIYDRHKDELVYIKNSANYPNLEYNEKLNCLTSWMFHGTTTTVFLTLEGNRLREIASVNTGKELIVSIVENGKTREIRREKMNEEDIYTRYTTYDPVTP
jgi:hypothetical protein